MTRVCVIGGGLAGTEAAREAALLGAEVTVLEKSARAELPWRSWPTLLSRTRPAPRPPEDRLPREGTVALEMGVEVESVLDGRLATTSGRRVKADAFVAATGSLLTRQQFLGQRKVGVWVMDSQSKYTALDRALKGVSSAVVGGEGAGGLQVSEQLRNRGCAVTLCLSPWDAGAPTSPLLGVLTDAAGDSGVKVEAGVPERAVGEGGLEAVILHGRVLPCDAFVVLPFRTPAPPRAGALTGAGGGLVVDRWLRTSVPSLYAAGGCAESGDSCMGFSSLRDSPAASGRIAGANAAGRAVAVSRSGSQSVSVFGLLWRREGVGLGQVPPSGRSDVFGWRWGPDSACSIAYDRRSGTVLGIEAVAPECSGGHQSTMPSLQRATLHTLAYCGEPSTDISMVSDTARLALSRWQDS